MRTEFDVGGGHSTYWESAGSRSGTPTVFLHGGPGARPGWRRYFDLHGYRGLLFDQGACGRSRPLASKPRADLSDQYH